MASRKKPPAALKWISRFLQFLIGVFGAIAIIGVFFKVQDAYPEWQGFFIALGFLGEAAAFIIMGAFSLIEGFFVSDEVVEDDGRVVRHDPAGEVSASFRTMMEERMTDDLNKMMGALNQDVQRFGSELRQMGAEMEEARSAMRLMHGEMNQVTEDGFAEGAYELSEGLRRLGHEVREMGAEMEHSRSAIKEARGALASMASGELADDARRFEQGMKALGDEVHAMSEEMAPARSAVECMREELNKVTSGNLAGDAERLGSGMRLLGDEMEGAGATVEAIRADLEQMAARFEQFNNPAPRDTNHKAYAGTAYPS